MSHTMHSIVLLCIPFEYTSSREGNEEGRGVGIALQSLVKILESIVEIPKDIP